MNYKDYNASGEYNFVKSINFKEQNPIIFDVGANIGSYSVMISKVFNNAQLYSFEPHPNNFKELDKLAQMNNFKSYPIGFSNTSGEHLLYDYENSSGSSHASLFNKVITDIHGANSQTISVNLLTIDEFSEKHKISRIDLLKIDTEGNEFNVLLGAKNLLTNNKIKIIQFEFSQLNIANRNFMIDFYQLLNNFSFFRILHNGLLPLGEYNPLNYENFLFQNIVAIQKDCLNRFNLHLNSDSKRISQ